VSVAQLSNSQDNRGQGQESRKERDGGRGGRRTSMLCEREKEAGNRCVRTGYLKRLNCSGTFDGICSRLVRKIRNGRG
jgi:hypothetical protein